MPQKPTTAQLLSKLDERIDQTVEEIKAINRRYDNLAADRYVSSGSAVYAPGVQPIAPAASRPRPEPRQPDSNWYIWYIAGLLVGGYLGAKYLRNWY